MRHAQLLALLGVIAVAPVQSQAALTLAQSIPLPGVEGRIDHMAIDLSARRIFVAGTLLVGTRTPARLKVMSTSGGRLQADIGIDGDPDDVFYDGKRRAVYVSCGAGFVDVVPLSLWVPELDRLYVAVPHRGPQPAEFRVYARSLP